MFAGPDGTSEEVTRRYGEFRDILVTLGRVPKEVRLSERRAWQLRLDDRMVLELGRADMTARLQRFSRSFLGVLAALPAAPAHLDLRYGNGFAVRVPGLTWNARALKGA